MKKFFKFIAGVASIGALACGAYYFFKKYVCKETPDDDFDDFDDDLDDYDTTDSVDSTSDNREYVSINITSDQDSKEDEASTETSDETADADSNEFTEEI